MSTFGDTRALAARWELDIDLDQRLPHHPGMDRRRFLLSLAALPPEPLEETEKLEQLRVLALGRRIRVAVVAHAGRGVDTPADYERFVQFYRQSQHSRAA